MIRTPDEEIRRILTGEQLTENVTPNNPNVMAQQPDLGQPGPVKQDFSADVPDAEDYDPLRGMGGPAPNPNIAQVKTPDQQLRQQAADQAKSYVPPSYKEKGIGRHMPQQYGQMGDPLGEQGDRPRTPDETDAELARINEQPGGLKLDQKKHTLGFGLDHAAIKDNYNSYVDERRGREEEERANRRQRASENRADIAEREQRLGQRMNDWQDITNGRPVGSTQNASTQRGMGSNVIFGRMRPMTDAESARARRDNAEADWMSGGRSLTELAKIGGRLEGIDKTVAGQRGVQQLRNEGGEKRQTLENAGDLAVANVYKESRAAFAKAIVDAAEVRAKIAQKPSLTPQERQGLVTMSAAMMQQLIAKREAGKKPTGWFNDGPPDPKNRDKGYDPKKHQLTDDIHPGSHDALATEFMANMELLAQKDPTFVPPPAMEALYDELVAEYDAKKKQQQGAAAGS